MRQKFKVHYDYLETDWKRTCQPTLDARTRTACQHILLDEMSFYILLQNHRNRPIR